LIDLKEDYSISHRFFFIEEGLRVGLCINVTSIFVGGDRYLIYFDIFIPLAEVSPKKMSVLQTKLSFKKIQKKFSLAKPVLQ
jgi:hypothetical protein